MKLEYFSKPVRVFQIKGADNGRYKSFSAISPSKIIPLVSVPQVKKAALAAKIGVKFITIPGGPFIYQGEKAQIDPFLIQETPFTIGQMKKLLEIKGDELRRIFEKERWEIDKILEKSIEAVADDVAEGEIDNCPLVYISQVEAEVIAELVGARLLTEMEWERAASGTTGLKRPWGNKINKNKAVYNDKGTRPVKSKPAGKSKEGVYDLIGLVWELTSSWFKKDKFASVIRGGAWDENNLEEILISTGRGDDFPRDKMIYKGFRLARTPLIGLR